MVRQKNEPERFASLPSIETDSAAQDYEISDSEDICRAEQSFNEWERNVRPRDAYVNYMRRLDEQRWKKSNARFWFNVKKIEETYQLFADENCDVAYDLTTGEIVYPETMNEKVAEQKIRQIDQMPEFGDCVLSCYDSSLDAEDSARSDLLKNASRRQKLNDIFDTQYVKNPKILLPKASCLSALPPPPRRLAITNGDRENPRLVRRRTRNVNITGSVEELKDILRSGNLFHQMFGSQDQKIMIETSEHAAEIGNPTFHNDQHHSALQLGQQENKTLAKRRTRTINISASTDQAKQLLCNETGFKQLLSSELNAQQPALPSTHKSDNENVEEEQGYFVTDEEQELNTVVQPSTSKNHASKDDRRASLTTFISHQNSDLDLNETANSSLKTRSTRKNQRKKIVRRSRKSCPQKLILGAPAVFSDQVSTTHQEEAAVVEIIQRRSPRLLAVAAKAEPTRLAIMPAPPSQTLKIASKGKRKSSQIKKQAVPLSAKISEHSEKTPVSKNRGRKSKLQRLSLPSAFRPTFEHTPNVHDENFATTPKSRFSTRARSCSTPFSPRSISTSFESANKRKKRRKKRQACLDDLSLSEPVTVPEKRSRKCAQSVTASSEAKLQRLGTPSPRVSPISDDTATTSKTKLFLRDWVDKQRAATSANTFIRDYQSENLEYRVAQICRAARQRTYNRKKFSAKL